MGCRLWRRPRRRFFFQPRICRGHALGRTGSGCWDSAAAVALSIVTVSAGVSPVLLLGLFYLFTALITNNASVVLMIPVAIEAAESLGADPFSFVLAVTFAASTAMLTPIDIVVIRGV